MKRLLSWLYCRPTTIDRDHGSGGITRAVGAEVSQYAVQFICFHHSPQRRMLGVAALELLGLSETDTAWNHAVYPEPWCQMDREVSRKLDHTRLGNTVCNMLLACSVHLRAGRNQPIGRGKIDDPASLVISRKLAANRKQGGQVDFQVPAE